MGSAGICRDRGRADPGPLSRPVLPPAVAATLGRLAALAPAAVEHAASALAVVLAPVLASAWPEVATGFSRLTNTGFPVEFAWSSEGRAVRWTAEVAAPEQPAEGRLALAGRLAGVTPERTAPLCAAQAGRRLCYGAWLGMRHDGRGDAPKLYAELPAGLPAGWERRHPLLRQIDLCWRMAGLSADGGVELYARAGALGRAALDRTEAAAFGASGRFAGPLDLLLGRSDLPRPSGLSLAFGPAGRIRSLTWFSFAKALFRNDAVTAERLSAALPGGAARDLYRALAAGPDDGRWRHGMIGIAVTAVGGPAIFQAGLRPT